MIKKTLYSTLLSFLLINAATAFSPASNNHDNPDEPVAYVAMIKPKQEKKLAAVIIQYNKGMAAAFEKHNIKNLQMFTESVGGKFVLLATYDAPRGSDYAQSWAEAAKDAVAGPWLEKVNHHVSPHPRVAGTEHKWVRCETICKIRPDRIKASKDAKKNPPTWHAAITGLRKKKEAEYRTLHQTVWPGVIDAIGNAGITRFDIFLTELGDEVFIFYLFEHTGSDFDAEMKSIANDPSTQRWWSFTDACQKPLPAAAARKEIWEPMEPLKHLNN